MRIYSTQLLIFVVLIGGIAFLFVFNPETVVYPPCLFKKMTGLQCPGCGSARACYHLLHGHFLTALDHNLLLTVFLPFLIIEGFSRLFLSSKNAVLKLRVIQNHIRPVHVLVAVIVFWVIRNLPFIPFRFLSSDQ